MKTMQEYARQYQHKNRGKGIVSNVTDYSLKFTTFPEKDTEQPKEYVVFKSWFLEL